MPTKYITSDLYALFLFASAELIAFIITIAIDIDGWAITSCNMLLVLFGGLMCHAIVRSVHTMFANRDIEDAAHAAV
jgi:hypothetical protein